MKSLVILAAVVLICQAAKVPQEATHQVTVPVPANVLAAASPTTSSPKDPTKTSIPAQVVEVAKDHVQVPKLQAVVMTTIKPDTKTMTTIKAQMTTVADPSIAKEIKRKTRAVPFIDTKKTKSANNMNVMKAMRPQKKDTMVNTMPLHRSMRSLKEETSTEVPVTVTIQPVTVTENPVVKSLDSSTHSTIDPCDLLCTKFEFEPICATNSLCLHEFPNQCILETYNCKHPSGKFSVIKSDRCQMDWLTKCDESEMI